MKCFVIYYYRDDCGALCSLTEEFEDLKSAKEFYTSIKGTEGNPDPILVCDPVELLREIWDSVNGDYYSEVMGEVFCKTFTYQFMKEMKQLEEGK